MSEINHLPTNVSDGQTGHLNSHQVIHAALKDHEARVDTTETDIRATRNTANQALSTATATAVRADSAEDKVGNVELRLRELETLGSLAPGDISDATATNLLLNPSTDFSGAVKSTQAEIAWGAVSEREPMTMVSVDEVAMENAEPQITPTYDDTGQAVHPDVIRIPGGFGPQGFEYWMGMTPYPDGNDATENPSVIASYDGETWEVPEGLTNPIAAPTTGFWPDPDVFFDHSIRRLYLVWLGMRISWSDNGVQWTEPIVLTPSLAGEVSPALVMESPGRFSMWSCQRVDGQINKILHRQATSLEDPDSGWSIPPVECAFTPPPGLEPWHIDVQKVGHGYWALISCCLAETSGAAAELFFATSPDGIRWDIGREPVLSGRRGEWDDTNIYRATLIPSDGRGDVLADVWYSARSATGQWRIARTQLTHRSPALTREVSRLAPLGLPADHLDTVRMAPNAKNLFPGDPTLMTPAGLVPLGWANNLPGATNHGWDQSREAYRVTGANGALIFQNDPPAIPGQWYTFSAEFASPDAGAAQVGMQFFDANGELINGGSGSRITGRADFQTMFVSRQAPANTSTMRLTINPRHKDPVGTGYYRRVQLEEGRSPTPWTSGVASEIRLDGVRDAQQVMVSPSDIRWRIGPDGVPVLPRFSDTNRPSASDSGLGAMIWNTTTGRIEVSSGVDWVPAGGSDGGSGGGSGLNLITSNASLMIPTAEGLTPLGWLNNLPDATDHGWDLDRGAYTVRARGGNILLSPTIPIEGSQWYTLSVEVASTDAGQARLGISWKDSSGTTISGNASEYITAASDFQRITHTLQAPPHARSAELTIQPGVAADGLREFFIRNAIFEQGTTASEWQWWGIGTDGVPVLPRFSDVDRPSASDSGLGAMIWNTTTGRMEISSGIDWVPVGGTDGVPVLPRFSDVDRPSASDSGLGAMIWNTTTGRMEISSGVDWVPAGGSDGGGGSSGGIGTNLITSNPSLMIPTAEGLAPLGWLNNLPDATDHGWDLNRGAYTVRARGGNILLSSVIPIEGSQWYTLSVEVASTEAGQARLGISWKDSSGTTISGNASEYITAASDFQRITHTLQAPPQARSAELTIQPGTSADGLREFFLRHVIFEQGTTASEWQSGANIRKPEIITTGRILEATDSDVILDISSGTVTLPAPAAEGQVHRLKNVADTPITVASRDVSVLIDGQPSITLSPGDTATVMMYAGQWITMA